MNLLDLFVQESVKAIPSLIVALTTLSLGWFVGSRISSHWTFIQRRKELDLETAQSFHKLYGEFFAVWKLWNYYIRDIGPEAFPEASRWELLNRACTAEGNVESLFVRLSSERKLSSNELELLGKFRQAYQQLREAIRDNEALMWDKSTHAGYLAFKDLGARVAFLILSENYRKSTESSDVAHALQQITSNQWEYSWSKNELKIK